MEDDDISVDSLGSQLKKDKAKEDFEKKKKGKGKAEYDSMFGDDDDDEEGDEFAASQEELEEERQDQCIRKIQSMYRAKRARALMKQLIKANYVKEYDEETGYFFYRNKRTGEVQYTKPVALGSDDLEDPKVYVAPPGYENDEVRRRRAKRVS